MILIDPNFELSVMIADLYPQQAGRAGKCQMNATGREWIPNI
jgi:hypothetical protein